MLGKIAKNRKGATLVEFAISALLFFMVLLSSMEWALEVYARHATERGLVAAMRVYSVTGDEMQARTAAEESGVYIISRCLEPIDFRLYDFISGVDLARPNSGRPATGTPADNSAVFARVELTCRWGRLTPLLSAMTGPEMVFSAAGVTQMR